MVEILTNFIVMPNSSVYLVNQVFHVWVNPNVHLIIAIILVLLGEDIKLILSRKHVFNNSLQLSAIFALRLMVVLDLNWVIIHLI